MDRATFACSTAFFRDYSSSSQGAFCLPGGHIDFIEKVESFTYSDFFRDYLIPNHPCIFSAKFTEDWGSRRSWVTWDGKPNFDYLLQKFGEAVVPVANCDVKEYNSNPKEQLPFKEYIKYWKEYIKNDYCSSRGCLYLKDWHLSRAFPEQDVYTTPVYFSSDWLNEYWDAIAVDDYRFVYMGPKGSWTPFHADVFRSYSWSANICGRKKWLLYPAGQEEYLKDRYGNLPFDVTAPGLQDRSVYPHYNQSQPPVEIVQEAGEIVFIPSGWHHQVYNLLIMKSCTGIDYKEFYNFLKVIAENRISVLENGLDDEASAKNTPKAAISTLGMLHAVFDLKRTVKVLTSLSANEDFKKLDLTSLSPPPEALLHHLKAAIDTALL
ncbi:2-oxoglutarate and iron-dependent oxygenase JMJD4 isoform X3 [Strigops habroptila]|uniref:2-oxoglutarate and iron-dependent oxygenase JMJD4 isoform X3 n=1 Tax=Strigops habroptila TaxID=2489341 RepID=UPI0011CFF8AC|nr:2-oxoglutarate and iron-dependent oxygenase JMJD4 isoform X3 [Strigops habroptila]